MQELFLGDCLEIMPREIEDKSIDLILCDLPYGTTACKWDVIIPFDKLWPEYIRIAKDNCPIVLFGSQPFTSVLICSNLRMFKYEWIWKKSNPANISAAKTQPMKYHESIIVFGKDKLTFNKQMIARSENGMKAVNSNLKNKNSWKATFKDLNSSEGAWEKPYDKYDKDLKNPSSIIEFNTVRPTSSDKVNHPTQKPVDLCEYLIKTYSNENDIVLDNACGSGSTLVAARNLGRNFIGIEKDQDYFNIASKRIFNK